MFQNALRMHLNAFERFEMRCAEKRPNANFVKPVFPKDGHKWYFITFKKDFPLLGKGICAMEARKLKFLLCLL